MLDTIVYVRLADVEACRIILSVSWVLHVWVYSPAPAFLCFLGSELRSSFLFDNYFNNLLIFAVLWFMFLKCPFSKQCYDMKRCSLFKADILVALVQNWNSPVFKYFHLKKYKHREGTQLYKNTLQRLEIWTISIKYDFRYLIPLEHLAVLYFVEVPQWTFLDTASTWYGLQTLKITKRNVFIFYIFLVSNNLIINYNALVLEYLKALMKRKQWEIEKTRKSKTYCRFLKSV